MKLKSAKQKLQSAIQAKQRLLNKPWLDDDVEDCGCGHKR